MKKQKLLALIFAVIFSIIPASSVYAEKDSDKASTKTVTTVEEDDDFPSLHSDYYMLCDLDTGRVITSKNADEKIYPASTTKILTAILALERCDNLDEVVVATSEAIDPIDFTHSNMGILVGAFVRLACALSKRRRKRSWCTYIRSSPGFCRAFECQGKRSGC